MNKIAEVLITKQVNVPIRINYTKQLHIHDFMA